MPLTFRARFLAGLFVPLLALPAQAQRASGAATQPQYVTGQAAVAVLGQKNFSSKLPGAAADELGSVTGLAVAGDRLIVCDGGLPFTAPTNNRVLIFNNLRTLQMGASASVVVGQPDFGKADPGLSEKSFNRPVGISTDGQRLAVADWGSNRVLIFNRIPTANDAAADVVVGQADFKSGAPDTSQTRMRGPSGVFLDGRRLFVADTLNHRVLIFNSIPTSSGAQADVILGQANFTSRAAAAPSNTSLRDPTAVFSDGTRLIITDLGHNRVLIYNRIPTSNNAPADVVVGQPDFTSEAAGLGPASLNFPRFAFTDSTRLFIADTGNNRVLVFNQIPATNGVRADAVLGQKSFQLAVDPQDEIDRITAGVLAFPVALAPFESTILVADSTNRRVLKFSPGVPLFTAGAVLSAGNFGGNGLPRPTGVQVEVQPEGALPAGDYYITVTAEGGILFESTPSEEVMVAIPEKSKLVVTFDEVAGATKYRVYVGGSPGGQTIYFGTETPPEGEPIKRQVEIGSLAPDPSLLNIGGPRLEITPGSIAVLFGRDLAPQMAAASSLPLPVELAGVSVLVNGIAAPLFVVSPTQINFQVPWETTGTSASVVVQQRTASGEVIQSTAVPVGVNELTPGVFTASGDGVGRLMAFHADSTPVSDARPLEPGERIFFFGTGVQKIARLGNVLAVATVDNRSKGEIKVTPEGTVTWSTSNVEGAQVLVSINGDAEKVVAEAPSGSFTPDFITPGQRYRFILRAFVDGALGEALSVALLDTRSPVAGDPTGGIGVTPEGLVTWASSNTPDARVAVSVDGRAEVPFAQGREGSRLADFIAPGHIYVFHLQVLVDDIVGNTITSATLDTRAAATPGLSGEVSSTPEGAVTWSTSNVSAAKVYVSVDDAQESVIGEGTSGNITAEADFIQPGHLYRFVLRTVDTQQVVGNGEPSPPEALVDTTHSVAIQGRDAPILFAGLAPGQVGVLQLNVSVAPDLELNGEEAEVRIFIGAIPANQVFLPVRDASAGEISVTREGRITWSTSNVGSARVFFSVDGGEEQPLAEGAAGELTVDFIAPGHVYRFILRKFVNEVVGKILATATLDTR